ncbi:MAG: hypothetical protein Q4A06_05710 [Cardiobacteriaceae bacterium]|nr:hypothetical protein [Cardiobacteriaceae bacterium]
MLILWIDTQKAVVGWGEACRTPTFFYLRWGSPSAHRQPTVFPLVFGRVVAVFWVEWLQLKPWRGNFHGKLLLSLKNPAQNRFNGSRMFALCHSNGMFCCTRGSRLPHKKSVWMPKRFFLRGIAGDACAAAACLLIPG